MPRCRKTILDDAPWLLLNSTLQIRAIRKTVKGYELNPTQMFLWDGGGERWSEADARLFERSAIHFVHGPGCPKKYL